MAEIKQKYGIEQLKSGKFAVVNIADGQVKKYSRLLSGKELKALDKTGKLPVGVTVSHEYPVVDIFNTVAQAKQFIKQGAKEKQSFNTGIFSSFQQAKKIKQLISK